MTAPTWEFPKDWPMRKETRKNREAAKHEWDNPEPCLYKLAYRGRALEIRKGPALPYPRRDEKRYVISVDGVDIAKGWSPAEAKPRAVKMVDRHLDEGEALVPLAETEAEKMVLVSCFPEDLAEMKVNMDAVSKAVEQVNSLREAEKGTSLVDYLKFDGTRVCRADSAVPDSSSSVHFTITGKIDLGSLPTLTTTVELLRESGQVTCDVVLPSRITL